MKVVKIDQKSDKWIEWRRQGIGASDCAAVLGLSKYKIAYDIWAEKTGRSFPIPINDDMERGINLESKAREEYQSIVGRIFIPLCAEHDKFPVIRASFDGVTLDHKEFIEIKCPRGNKLWDIVSNKDLQALKEKYPDYYYQIQHQYAVDFNLNKGHLVIYQNNDIISMHIEKDEKFIKNKLMPSLLLFWGQYVITDDAPLQDEQKELYIDDPDAIKLAKEWKRVSEDISMLEEKESILRRKLIELGDDGDMIIGNVIKMKRCSTSRIDYKQACKDNNINLLQYTKESIGYYKFTKLKQ